MKIVVTGSESFVGRELIGQCQQKGIGVFGIDAIAPKDPNYEFLAGDIRDRTIRTRVPGDADALVHLAALSRDPDCREKIYECFDVNVMGTLNILEAAKEKGIKQFIFASSEWVYDSFPEGKEKDEDAPIAMEKLTSEYALSKLVAEGALRIDHSRTNLPTTILRFGIIYGPRANNWSAVESLASKVKRGQSVEVGSKRTGRRFVHVSDIARGILASVGRTGFEIFNLTSDRGITLGDVIDTSSRIFGMVPDVRESSPEASNVRNPSNKKAKDVLGWSPENDLEHGIQSLEPYL